MDAAFGRVLPIASAGRSYAEQAEAYRKYLNGGPLALRPGTSVHESGNAIDWGYQVYALLNLYAGLGWRGLTINKNGHRRTVSSEVWHTEYDANEDNFRGQGAPAGGTSYAAAVNDIQALANKLGARLEVDGIYGAGTAGWVRAFQGDHGLAVDGIVGPATWAKMQEVWANAQGDLGTKQRQSWLNTARGEKLDVDGRQGPATTEAIKRYQSFLGVDADGQWGEGTQAAHAVYYGNIQAYLPFGGSAWVEAIQDKLARLGYSIAKDGNPGPATATAVKDFQAKNGLAVDGIAGPATNNKLDAVLTAPQIGRNATDRPTVEIQKFLIAQGFDLAPYGADGDYGVATTEAVEAWQKKVGLEPDGVWGPLADAKAFSGAPVKEWPVNGRNATTRLTKDVQAFLISKGFSVGSTGADGIWGADTSVAAAKWQDSVGLDADGIWGPASDAKAFPGVPLPDAPVDPGQDPTYGKKTPTYPGATWADVSPNKSVRTEKVQALILHHRADTGTAASARKRFMAANDRNVSPNWNVNQDGSADEIVPPDQYRAWTTGQIDHSAITIETGNTSGEPNWGISDASHERIADILAWGAHRYGFPIQRGAAVLQNGKNVITKPGLILHRETPAGKETGTICPGPSMDADRIIRRAKEIYQQKYTAPTPTPEPTPTPTPTPTPEIPADKVLVNRQGLIELQRMLDDTSVRIDELLED